METAESPLDVLSRAAVMIQRNVLPPPSYDEARSLSQQQNQKLQTRCKVLGLTSDDVSSSSSYDKPASVTGKWKREKKYQCKTTVAASACDSTINDYKTPTRFNGRCVETASEPLDMSKRATTKDRGEPPSYFQSILCSNYNRRLTDVPVTVPATDETSCTSSTSIDENESTMCDQVINEHFRRSLGRDYVNVFSSVKTTKKNQSSEEIVSQSTTSKIRHEGNTDTRDAIRNTSSSLSVDDHFAKALGDTWIKLQQQEKRLSKNQRRSQSMDED